MHPQFTPSETARFWSKVNFDGPVILVDLGPCWLWTGTIAGKGYGYFSLFYAGDHARIGAHRYAYWQLVGPPGELFVCHTCDTPNCVNPVHLFLGTNTDNMADMKRKGRGALGDRNGTRTHPEKVVRGDRHRAAHPVVLRGEDHPLARLTAAQVEEIRRRKAEPRKVLALEFGISLTHLGDVIRGVKWAWLNR